MEPIFNFRMQRVGGITFIRIGFIFLSFGMTYKPWPQNSNNR